MKNEICHKCNRKSKNNEVFITVFTNTLCISCFMKISVNELRIKIINSENNKE